MSTIRINSLAFFVSRGAHGNPSCPLSAPTGARLRKFSCGDAPFSPAAMQEAKSLGYASETVQMGVFASVAYLDESILNLQNPVFADGARRPLQEELFGGHLAGETFFP